MRRFILSVAAALSLLAAGSLLPGRADAMTIPVPAGIRLAIDETNLVEDVRIVCRRVWRCGRYGCGWRRACWRTGRYWRPYWYGRPYGYRWYYGRPYWRYRYWRRHW